MRLLKKIAAGLLLLCGLPLTLALTIQLLDPNLSSEDKEGSVPAIVLFGLPPIAIAGWLIYSLRQQHESAENKSDRAMEQLFLQELQANGGVINPIIFATKAGLSLDETKSYLDEKAVQLNALYEATEQGGVEYRFPL
ncbi:MAG: hypothetical protein AAFR26_07015 [Cyanobacteria bacterium J06626_4]